MSQSQSNIFSGTSLDNAYKFETFSPYIANDGLRSQFSSKCIFCSSTKTVNLTKDDGSFKHCNQCKKQFKALFVNSHNFMNVRNITRN
jgi:hypothetical protein